MCHDVSKNVGTQGNNSACNVNGLVDSRQPTTIHISQIMLLNCAGIYNKTLFPDFWTNFIEMDFFSLTETWSTREFSFPQLLNDFKSVQSFATKNNVFGRPSGGLIFGYNSKKIRLIDVLSINRFFIAVSAEYIIFKNITIIICYFPPSNIYDSEFIEFLGYIANVKAENIIVMGDCNARIGCLEKIFVYYLNEHITHKSMDNSINHRGRLLIECCKTNNLIVLNGSLPGDREGAFTFFGGNGASVLDLIIVSNSVYTRVTDLEVIPKLGSDHLPVVASLEGITSHGINKEENLGQIVVSKWTDAEGSSFVLQMENFFFTNPNIEPDDLIPTMSREAEKVNLLVRKNVHKNPVLNYNAWDKWFDQDCRRKKVDLRKNLRNLQKNNNENNRTAYKICLKEYKILCTTKKINYYEVLNSQLFNCKDSQTFWNIIKSFRKKNFNQNSIGSDVWFDYFSQIFKSNSSPFEASFLPEENLSFIDPILDCDITVREVSLVLNKLKSGKAPGCDALKPEFFKYLGNFSLIAISNIFNRILETGQIPSSWILIIINPIYKKGDVSDPANYRPISLIPVVTKIFTSILNNRLLNFLNSHHKLLEEQAGFRKNYSCLDQIFILNCLIDNKLKKKRGKIYSVFVDFKGAFDNVNHEILFSELKKNGVSPGFIRILRNIYNKAYAKVRSLTNYTEPFKINSGVLQGEVLSPILFSLFLNDLIIRLNTSGISDISFHDGTPINILLYADDAVILADSTVNLNKKLRILERYCSDHKLKVNINKTKVMVFRKGGKLSKHDKFYYENNKLEIVSNYIYLGVPFSSSGSFSTARKHFSDKAVSAIHAMWPIVTGAKVSSPGGWFRLFNSLVTSVLSYGSPVWSISYISELEYIQNSFIKKLFNLSRYTPGYILRLELGQTNTSILFIKLILKFWIRILKMNDHRFTKIAYKHYFYNHSDPIKFNWTLKIKSIIENSGFSFVWLSQDPDVAIKFLPQILLSYIDQCKQSDMISMENSQHYSHYKFIKLTPFIEDYITSKIDLSLKRILFQLRLNKETIFFEGKLFKINSKENCKFCNLGKPESWEHVFFYCPMYSFYRFKYLSPFIGYLNNFNVFLTYNHKKFLPIVNFIKSAQKLNQFLLESCL